MKNIRFFFNEIHEMLCDENNYYSSHIHPYKSVNNIDYSKFADCRDEIFYKLSAMVEDARKIYALAVIQELEVQLDYDLVDKKEKIETVRSHKADSISFSSILKEEADKKGIIGEPYIEEISLHEHKGQYLEINCLISDIGSFIDEIQRIFTMFSINLHTIAKENSIDIEYFTADESHRFQANLNDTQRDLLFELLANSGFIPKKTDKDSFILAFGGKVDKYTNFKITWLKNKQLLRELLIPLKHSEIIQAAFERLIPFVFINENNNPITLAKNKPVPSLDSDTIAEIHKRIATI